MCIFSLSRSSSASSWNVDQPTPDLSYTDTLHMANWLPAGITLRTLLESETLGLTSSVPKTSPFGTWNKTGSDSGFCSSPSLDGGSLNSNDPGSVALQKSYKMWGDLNVDIDTEATRASVTNTSRIPTASGWPDLTTLVICAAGSSGEEVNKSAAASLSAAGGVQESETGSLEAATTGHLGGELLDAAGTSLADGGALDGEEVPHDIKEKIHELLDDDEEEENGEEL